MEKAGTLDAVLEPPAGRPAAPAEKAASSDAAPGQVTDPETAATEETGPSDAVPSQAVSAEEMPAGLSKLDQMKWKRSRSKPSLATNEATQNPESMSLKKPEATNTVRLFHMRSASSHDP